MIENIMVRSWPYHEFSSQKPAHCAWQVDLQGTALTPLKPKMYLTCSMVLARDEWVQLK